MTRECGQSARQGEQRVYSNDMLEMKRKGKNQEHRISQDLDEAFVRHDIIDGQ